MQDKRSVKEKLLKGGAWAFAGKLVTALSGLAISTLLARLLTPEEMGAYFLTFSLVSVAAVVAQMGLAQTVVRLVAESMGTERPSRARQSVLLALRLVAFGGIVVACLLAFGGGQWIAVRFFKSVIMSQVVGLAAVWAVILAFQGVIAEVYRGFHDIRLATIFGGLTTSVLAMGLFFILWLLQGHSQFHQIMLLTVGSGISSVLLSSVFLWGKLKLLPSEESNVSTLEVLRISWVLWVTALTLFIVAQVDLWIMGAFRSPEEVAVYGAAARIVALVTMPLLIVNAVVPPLIAEMYAQGKIKELEKTLRLVATLTGIPSLVVLGVFVFFGDSILGLFFGEYYQTGFMILVILSIGQLANVWSGSCALTLMLLGHQFTMMYTSVFCGVFTAVLAWFLVEIYGGAGVAISAASGMTLQNLLMLLLVKRKLGIWTHVDLCLVKKVGAMLK